VVHLIFDISDFPDECDLSFVEIVRMTEAFIRCEYKVLEDVMIHLHILDVMSHRYYESGEREHSDILRGYEEYLTREWINRGPRLC